MTKQNPTSPPNIVFFMCDQLRADALGFMGNTIVRTPNLDKLAQRGTVFEKMFVQAPTCMPSRAAIMTGRYPRTCGMVGSGGLPLVPGDDNSELHKGGGPLLNPNERTLPELLQRGGYRTGLFGKLHLTPQVYTLQNLKSIYPVTDAQTFLKAAGMGEMPANPIKNNYGFEDVSGYEDALIGNYVDWLKQRDPKLARMLPKWPANGMSAWEGAPRPFNSAVRDVAKTIVPPDLHPSMFVAESAAAHFTKHAPKQPCFTYVSFTDPHHPFDPPAELAEKYLAKDIPLPKHRSPEQVTWPKRLQQRSADFSSVDDDQTRTIISYYYAMIEMVDKAVGKVIDSVEQAGQMDNTIFAFVADHGELLGDYGLFKKGSYLYDSLTHVPAFVAGPGIGERQRIQGLSQTIDLAPTLLGLAGLAPDPGMQGRNLATALGNGTVPARPWVFTEAKEAAHGPYLGCWSLRTERAKLNIYPHDHAGLLFDLDDDPDECNNLYNDPAHRALRDDMTVLLFEVMQHQLDPLPLHLSGY